MTTRNEAAALNLFADANAALMYKRLLHGAKKFGALSWREGVYTDSDNLRRLDQAVIHLTAAIIQLREGSVGWEEVKKRAADVANQAFMVADSQRKHE